MLREIRADVSTDSLRDYVWSGRTLVAKVERTPSGSEIPAPWTEAKYNAGTDHLGTVRKWTGPDGLEVANHIYYPFGQELTGATSTDRMRYTGHERDLWNTSSSADDLDYMHARHYNLSSRAS